MRVVIVSDTHNLLSDVPIPDGDVLLHCGDWTESGTEAEVKLFAEHLQKFPHKTKIVIAGNHDMLADSNPIDTKLILGKTCNYLNNSSIVVDGLKFYGSPYTPSIWRWAFNLPTKISRFLCWQAIEQDTDILITHGPPYSIRDLCDDMTPAGCEELYDRVKKLPNLKLHTFGHIHESYGSYRPSWTETLFVNASTCNRLYEPMNPPVVLDYVNERFVNVGETDI